MGLDAVSRWSVRREVKHERPSPWCGRQGLEAGKILHLVTEGGVACAQDRRRGRNTQEEELRVSPQRWEVRASPYTGIVSFTTYNNPEVGTASWFSDQQTSQLREIQ